MSAICPKFGLEITKRSNWQYVADDNGCSCSLQLVGKNIILFTLSGVVGNQDATNIRECFLVLLNDVSLLNKPTYCMVDMSDVVETDIGTKKDFSSWTVAGRKHLQLLVYFNVASKLSAKMESGILGSKNEGSVFIAKDYEQACKMVMRHQDSGVFELTREQLEMLVQGKTEALSQALEKSKTMEEQLNEMYLDVVFAQEKAEDKLREAENLIAGLQVLNSSLDTDKALKDTVTLLSDQLNYEHAFLLVVSESGVLEVLSSTSKYFECRTWIPQKFFNKVLKGNTTPVYDVSLIPEWSAQEDFEVDVLSAIHIPLRTGSKGAILVCTHSEKGFFTQKHADIGKRFSVLATQSLIVAELMDTLKLERDTLDLRVKERTSEIRAILNAQPDLMFRADKHGVFLDYKKPEGVNLYTERTNFIGKKISDIMPDTVADNYSKAVNKAYQTGEVQVVEYSLEIEGQNRIYEARIVVPQGSTENLIFIRDITRRKREELELKFQRSELALRVEERTVELQTMNQELKEAVKAKDKFLAIVSHELRTPLNVILGVTEALEDSVYGALNDRQIESLGRISESGVQLLDLINDILDLARIDSGQLSLRFKSVDIGGICLSSVDLIREVARSRNIDIALDIKNSSTALVDELRLKQILMNLLGNAVKFTNEGGKVRLGLEMNSDRGTIEISVSDTGIGIAEEDLNKLFKHFSQLDSGMSRQYQGTGLGLAMVKRLSKMHGGDVSVQSKLGAGSVFTVTLPWKKE